MIPNVSNVLKGETQIERIYHGDDLVWEHSKLPKGWKRCLFISGTEKCIINFKFDVNDIVELDMRFTKGGNSRQLLSITEPIQQGQCSYFGISENGLWEIGGGIYFTTPKGTERTCLKVSSSSYGAIRVQIGEAVKIRTGGVGINSFLMHLFTSIGGQYSIIDKVEYYGVKLYKNGLLHMNLIPCLDSNEIPCMYDTVSKTPFYNQGTGKFGYEIA